MAIRDNELAAASMGIPTARYMVLAFAWSGFVVGTAGALYAVLVRQVSPEAFDLLELILHFGIVIVGGLAQPRRLHRRRRRADHGARAAARPAGLRGAAHRLPDDPHPAVPAGRARHPARPVRLTSLFRQRYYRD